MLTEFQSRVIGKTQIFPAYTPSGVIVLAVATVIKRVIDKDKVNVCYCIPELPSVEVDPNLASIIFDKVKDDVYKFAAENNAVMGGY